MAAAGSWLRMATPVTCLVAAHGAALLHRPLLAVGTMAVVAAANTGLSLAGQPAAGLPRRAGGGRGMAAIWAAIAGAMMLVLILAGAGWPQLAAVVTLPPIVINFYLLVLFGRTLLPGCEPLITRFSRHECGVVPDAVARYTRRLTLIWTGMFAVLMVQSALLAAFADMAVWSWFANVLNPLLSAVFFLGEHVYRQRYYGHLLGPVSPLRTLRTVATPSLWLSGR